MLKAYNVLQKAMVLVLRIQSEANRHQGREAAFSTPGSVGVGVLARQAGVQLHTRTHFLSLSLSLSISAYIYISMYLYMYRMTSYIYIYVCMYIQSMLTWKHTCTQTHARPREIGSIRLD